MIIGFRHIWALALLVTVAGLAAWYVRSTVRASRARDLFADHVRQTPTGLGPAGMRALLGPALIIIAALLSTIAIARPLGPPGSGSSGVAGMDVIVALDISDSMAVPDMDGNTRLAAAKQAVAGLVKDAPSNRYGLVLFSGEAVVSCPLTVDQDAFLTFLDGADFSSTILPGTAIGEAVLTAATRFKKSELPRAVVVVSDGENTYGADPVEAAVTARERGLKVYTLGVGTTDGGPIPMGRDFFGDVMYKKDRAGRTVNSRLDEDTLRKVASAGGGEYLDAGGSGAVKKLADYLRAEKTTEVAGLPPDAKELGPYFALAAFALVTAAIVL
jgi:Ca-activated chloride channel homolog